MTERNTRNRLYGASREDAPIDGKDAIQEARSQTPGTYINGYESSIGSGTDRRLYGAAFAPHQQIEQSEECLPVKVLVVDDHAILREGLISLLSLEDDMEVVGEADNGRHAVDLVRGLAPDVVLLDLMMPIMDGLEAAKRMRQLDWSGKILVLTQYDDELHMAASINAGVTSFISKSNAGPILVDAIRKVSRGEPLLHPNVGCVS